MILFLFLFLFISTPSFSMEENSVNEQNNTPTNTKVEESDNGEEETSNRERAQRVDRNSPLFFKLPFISKYRAMGSSGVACQGKEGIIVNPACGGKGLGGFFSSAAPLSLDSPEYVSGVLSLRYSKDNYGGKGGIVANTIDGNTYFYLGGHATVKENVSVGMDVMYLSTEDAFLISKDKRIVLLSANVGALFRTNMGIFGAVWEGLTKDANENFVSNFKVGYSKELKLEDYTSFTKGKVTLNSDFIDLFHRRNLAFMDRLRVGAEFLTSWKYRCHLRGGLEDGSPTFGVGINIKGVEFSIISSKFPGHVFADQRTNSVKGNRMAIGFAIEYIGH